MLFVTVLLLLACIMSGILSVSPYKDSVNTKKLDANAFWMSKRRTCSDLGEEILKKDAYQMNWN